MKKLHPQQEKLLDLLKAHVTDPLTVRELQDALGASSPSVVHHHIQQLEKRGYLRRNPSNPKDYQVLSDTPDPMIAYINLYGLAQCGPGGAILDGDPVDQIPLSTKLLGFSAQDAFMVKARGESMMPSIQDGDLVIAKRSQTFRSGDMVVCVNDGEALIKKIQTQGPSAILVSTNPVFEPFLAVEDFRVEGIVRGVYSYL